MASNHLVMPLDEQVLREARERLSAMIDSRAPERDFQSLFAECPWILSRALPLRIEPREIVALGNPGKSEPDFLFYPRAGKPISPFGVIELKRPDSQIVTVPRKDTICLTRDAATAVAQVKSYSRTLQREMLQRPESALFLGDNMYLFIIMGLSSELANKVGTDVMRDQIAGLLPPSCQIIPYDQLLRRFEAVLPKRVFWLVPDDTRRSFLPEMLRKEAEKAEFAFSMDAGYADVVITPVNSDCVTLSRVCEYLKIRSAQDLWQVLHRATKNDKDTQDFLNNFCVKYAVNAKISADDLLQFLLVGSHAAFFTVDILVKQFGWEKIIAEVTLDAKKYLPQLNSP